MRKTLHCLMAAAVILMLGISAQATTITSGQCTNPTGTGGCLTGFGTFSDSVTLLASMSSPVNTATYTGTLLSAVYNDNGTLDFYYQFTSNAGSTNSVTRITMTDFTGFTTNVGYSTTFSSNGFTSGGNTPLSADRLSANVVGFNFNVGGTNDSIGAGQDSAVLIIKTNATLYTTGLVNTIDGSVSQVSAFEPTCVPEPVSMALMGSGLLMLGLWRRKRS